MNPASALRGIVTGEEGREWHITVTMQSLSAPVALD